MATKKQKKRPGRPARPMPERIPDTPENVAKALMTTPPLKKWDYLEREQESRS